MMDRLALGQDWFNKLLPEGLPVPSSTIISGPGGSGKPLIGADDTIIERGARRTERYHARNPEISFKATGSLG